MKRVFEFPVPVRRLRSLLLLVLWLTGITVFAPAAFAQAEPPTPPSPLLFTLPDIMNAPALVKKLSAQADPVSAFVWSQLSAATQHELAGAALPSPRQLSDLVAGLNSILQTNSPNSAQRFAGVPLLSLLKSPSGLKVTYR